MKNNTLISALIFGGIIVFALWYVSSEDTKEESFRKGYMKGSCSIAHSMMLRMPTKHADYYCECMLGRVSDACRNNIICMERYNPSQAMVRGCIMQTARKFGLKLEKNKNNMKNRTMRENKQHTPNS